MNEFRRRIKVIGVIADVLSRYLTNLFKFLG